MYTVWCTHKLFSKAIKSILEKQKFHNVIKYTKRSGRWELIREGGKKLKYSSRVKGKKEKKKLEPGMEC